MLNVFTLANGRLFQEEIDRPEDLPPVNPVWVDLEDPTPEEKGWIAARFNLFIPQDIIDDDLEESARFYEEEGAIHIRSDFLIDDDETPRNVRVAFILHNNVLFSIHREDLPGSRARGAGRGDGGSKRNKGSSDTVLKVPFRRLHALLLPNRCLDTDTWIWSWTE